MSRFLAACVVVAFALLAVSPAVLRADPDAPLKHANVDEDRVAIKGYDAVSYFSGKPQKGIKSQSVSRNNVIYQFANEENKKKFLEKPEMFVPAYGGWCATAMADGGRKVEIDPNSFKITNNRLFLFYKGWRGDALKDWNKDEAKNLRSADDNWKRVSAE